jgi:Uma2 family endonuclease
MRPTGYRHGRIEARIAAVLSAFVDAGGLGEVLTGDVGIYTRRGPDRVRAADVLYISHGTAAQRSEDRPYLDIAPELVVEILSPEDHTEEVTQMLREYFAIGVRVVWIVDPEARSVFAHRSLTDVREFRAGELLSGDEVLPGFLAPVATLFK